MTLALEQTNTTPGVVLAVASWNGCTHSAEIGKLMEALATAQTTLRGAAKDSVNPHLSNSYADLSSVWSAWQEAGPKNGLAVTQMVEAGPQSVTVHSILGHASGQWIRDTLSLPWAPQKGITAAQAIGSVITYARRYALAALVGVCPEEDDGASSGPRQEDPKALAEARQALVALFASEAACEEWLAKLKKPALAELPLVALRGAKDAVEKAKAKKAAEATEQPAEPEEKPAEKAPPAQKAPTPKPLGAKTEAPAEKAAAAKPEGKKPASPPNQLKFRVVHRAEALFGKDDAGQTLFHRWCDRMELLEFDEDKQRPSVAASNLEQLQAALAMLNGLTDEEVAEFARECHAEDIAIDDAASGPANEPWEND